MRRVVFPVLLSILLLSLLSLQLNFRVVSADSYYFNFNVAVTPESPSTHDMVNVTVSFETNYIYAIPANFSSLSKNENNFSVTIEIYPIHGPFPVTGYEEETYNMENLTIGLYHFNVDVQVWSAPPDELFRILLESASYNQSFTVASPLIVTVVRLDPATVELGPVYCVNDTFTLSARIDDVEYLYGFDFNITWNTTYLDYVTHLPKVPVESYPDGILHEPMLVIKDQANASEGWYWLAATSLSPAPSFNGSGIAFEITFRVRQQLVAPAPIAYFQVRFASHDLADLWACCGPPHYVENCTVTIHPYPDWNIADINGDLKVDIYDIVLGVNAYDSTPGDPHWNPDCDIAEPYGKVDLMDIVMIAMNYGEEYTP